MAERLTITHEQALAVSDRLLKAAMEANANVLDTYAGFQLATMVVAQVALSTSEEHAFEENRTNLVQLLLATADQLQQLKEIDVADMRQHLMRTGLLADETVH